MLDLVKKNLATGIDITDCDVRAVCECCVEQKFARIPFPKRSKKKSKQPLELVHVDLCGPMQESTPGRFRYYLVIIDDFSRYSTVFCLRNKSDAEECLKNFVREMKVIFGGPPKVIRSDNGGEFQNASLERFYKTEGIRQQFTTPYTPQQNGVAERKNRSLVEMAKCMMRDANLPLKFWSEAVKTACYLQNRLPTRSVEKTPFELWRNEKPDLKQSNFWFRSVCLDIGYT